MAGFRVLQGKPCFHPVDAADRYSSLHGPGAYLWNALFLKMRPDDLSAIFYSKLAGVVAYTLALVAVATSMMRLLGGLRGWIATGLVIGMAGFFDQFVYWNHPDPHLLGASALSLLLLPGKANTRAHTILFGVLGGWVFNLKIHAVLAFLPVAMSMIAQRRVAHLAFSIAMGLLVAMLPFCFADRFSASNYIDRLRLAAGHAKLAEIWWLNCDWLRLPSWVLIGVVLARLWYWVRDRPQPADKPMYDVRFDGWFFLGLGIAIPLVAMLASKAGAGPHHFIMLLPAMAYAAISICPRDPHKHLVFALILIVAVRGVFEPCQRRQNAVRRNIERFDARQRPALARLWQLYTQDVPPEASVQMGYGGSGSYVLTYLRPVLAGRGNTDRIGVAAAMDTKLSGISLTPQNYRLLSSGQIEYWILPNDTKPFELKSFYSPWFPEDPFLFDDRWRDLFRKHYRCVRQNESFALYQFAPSSVVESNNVVE
ncbi:MAG: hypothetical protein AAF958_20040 [Planctomycetota bacterium]